MSFSGFPSQAAQGGSFLNTFGPAALLGGLSAVTGIYGANKAAATARDSDNTSKQIAQAQLDAQRAGIFESRELAKGNLGFGMFDKVFSAGTGADLDFGRQRNAALFQAGPLASLEAANKRDAFRAEIGMRGSAETKALEQAANREALKRTLAEKQGAMAGMFGRIAQDPSTLFG
jgi:hypothetical protein